MADDIGLEEALKQAAYVLRGEWWELRLPERLAALDLKELLALSPVPPKLAAKLVASREAEKKAGVLRLRLFPEEAAGFAAEWTDLAVHYEDDFILVVDKPAGMPVHPDRPEGGGTLANAVAAYYESTGQACRVRHIHRLDTETTGLVLYAKNALAHQLLDEAMRDKRIRRSYEAVAEGRLEARRLTVEQPIGRDRHHPQRRRVSPGGERAVTHVETVERFDTHTHLRLELETGRTHQIRVHLAWLGHPLAGDELYGGRTDRIKRQALHGARLAFPHPWTGAQTSAVSELPDDMRTLLEQL